MESKTAIDVADELLQWAATTSPADARGDLAENGAAVIKRLHAALVGMVDHYTTLVNSGDCGFWNPEIEPVVIAAREAMRNVR